MADIEQMKKIVPFITCEISLGQNVCELMFGINVPNLNLVVQIHSVQQPMLHCPQKHTTLHWKQNVFRLMERDHCLLDRDWCAWLEFG